MCPVCVTAALQVAAAGAVSVGSAGALLIKRMGWTFPWVSSFGTDFNYDFHVTLDPDLGSVEYNFANASDLVASRKLWSTKGELPGLSVFLREDGTVYH